MVYINHGFKNSYVTMYFYLGTCISLVTNEKCTACEIGFFGFPNCKGKINVNN